MNIKITKILCLLDIMLTAVSDYCMMIIMLLSNIIQDMEVVVTAVKVWHMKFTVTYYIC
jgi:hypothetical protein